MNKKDIVCASILEISRNGTCSTEINENFYTTTRQRHSTYKVCRGYLRKSRNTDEQEDSPFPCFQ